MNIMLFWTVTITVVLQNLYLRSVFVAAAAREIQPHMSTESVREYPKNAPKEVSGGSFGRKRASSKLLGKYTSRWGADREKERGSKEWIRSGVCSWHNERELERICPGSEIAGKKKRTIRRKRNRNRQTVGSKRNVIYIP